MFEQLSQAMSIRVKISLPIKSMILFALVAALSSSTFAQTQSATDISGAVTTMVASANADPAIAVPAAEAPISSANKPAPMPVGAGSDHGGYVFARGYFFSINRSDGDPAVINVSGSEPDVINGNGGFTTTSVDEFETDGSQRTRLKRVGTGRAAGEFVGAISIRISLHRRIATVRQQRHSSFHRAR